MKFNLAILLTTLVYAVMGIGTAIWIGQLSDWLGGGPFEMLGLLSVGALVIGALFGWYWIFGFMCKLLGVR